MVRAAPSLELLYQVLDVAEAVGCGEVQQDAALLLQGHLLEVLVPEGSTGWAPSCSPPLQAQVPP